jgi:aspartyl/asparaginyl beta-hydroxylase
VFQRPHQRSQHALDKQYRFAWWPLAAELAPLVDEIRQQQPEWLESQWKWHVESRFSLLRAGQRAGYAGSELTNGHSIDQPNLERLPRLLQFLDTAFPIKPALAWLGRMPQGARIFTHVDNTQHWDEHHRLHVPLITNPQARLCVSGRFLSLQSKRIWLLNNSLPHGALNRGPERLHLVLDLPHFAGFDAWLAQSTHELGELDPPALAELDADPLHSPAVSSALESARLARFLAQ